MPCGRLRVVTESCRLLEYTYPKANLSFHEKSGHDKIYIDCYPNESFGDDVKKYNLLTRRNGEGNTIILNTAK